MSSSAEKLSYLEETMAQLAYAQLKTEMSLQTLFSSLYMDDSLVAYLNRKGIYALTLKDDTMDIVNWDQ